MSRDEPRVVLIDNYDSYVYNLYQRLGEITGRAAVVLRNDRTTVEAVRALEPTHLVVSPGPGSPEKPEYAGICEALIHAFVGEVPILGVCLGHQAIGAAFGARIVRAPTPMHGKASRIVHEGTGLLRGLASPLVGMRYHSLVVDEATVPSDLAITARTEDGIIMALEHRDHPVFGIQFHPESIGTPDGIAILENFVGTS